ncbi:MAG: NtaA/DmoA family FMN-dependent monooxygenase [Proteobacteria bacterium]|nr:NtaA/DmoA family FMN-dependent monooxygenase [Pseudomonadota bacterium]
MAKPFHLAWFLSRGYSPKAWRFDWAGDTARSWLKPDLFVDLAVSLERACFDYVIIEDSSHVPRTYGKSHDVYLKYAVATPKMDPAVLVPYMAQATKHIGIVPTLSTAEYPPYLLARLVNTLDHTTGGRVGWNMVTGSSDHAAENYGHDRQFPHDERYDRADEFTEIVTQLWESWEPDAIVADTKTPLYADGSKVHPIKYEGKYFRCHGPLNAPRSPQVRPVLCQAGGSKRGQAFAARWADTIISFGESIPQMKAFRTSVRTLAAGYGRNPDDIKVLFLAYPIVDTTMEIARERRRLENEAKAEHIEMALSQMSLSGDIDFSTFDPDVPLPELTSNGHQSEVSKYTGRTLRSLAMEYAIKSGIDYTGTPDHVSGLMAEIMEEVGGDGFLLFNSDFTRRYIMEVCDGLVPALQRRGLTRTEYPYATFRDNLTAF